MAGSLSQNLSFNFCVQKGRGLSSVNLHQERPATGHREEERTSRHCEEVKGNTQLGFFEAHLGKMKLFPYGWK